MNVKNLYIYIAFGLIFIASVASIVLPIGETIRLLAPIPAIGTALPHASSLLEIRRKWALWLTPTLETELERFETAVRKIGANAYLLQHAPGEPGAIKEMYSLFAEVLGFEKWDDRQLTGDLTVTAVIKKLREVLGTDELNLLRSGLVHRALTKMQDSG